jgi:protein-S-isoprenylcysteine O-methyltransferase Ste14
VNTFSNPDQLVTDGLYRFSRNPMYLGFALVLIGVWLLLGRLTPLMGVLLFVLVADRWYIAYEECRLVETFGQAFTAYKAHTRRWL